jgi:high frequency lysogenization protein
MQQQISTQTLALAALCQCIRQVQMLARGEQKENFSQPEFRVNLQSIAEQNPTEALDVYGGRLENLSTGYHILFAQLGDSPKKDMDLIRYGLAVLKLERLLARSADTLATVGKRIERLEQQLLHFQITDDNIIATLADIYVDNISGLGNRIQIAGQPEQLKQPLVQQKIRALLLAALRAAVLWRQAGGHRYHFILKRKALLQEAKSVLQQLA